MVVKIINKSDLNYKQIGEIIDEITNKVTTNYIGKWGGYEFNVKYKKYIVETLIMKTCFKVYISNR